SWLALAFLSCAGLYNPAHQNHFRYSCEAVISGPAGNKLLADNGLHVLCCCGHRLFAHLSQMAHAVRSGCGAGANRFGSLRSSAICLMVGDLAFRGAAALAGGKQAASTD